MVMRGKLQNLCCLRWEGGGVNKGEKKIGDAGKFSGGVAKATSTVRRGRRTAVVAWAGA